MPYFKTDDGCLIYFETRQFDSSHPLVVFLNGSTQTSMYWRTVSDLLKDRFRVLTYDARAQGRSDIGERELSLEAHALDLLALLEYLKIDRAHFAGLSHGAGVALALACRAPECIDRLVLCSATARPTCRTKLVVKSWLAILEKQDIEAMAWAALPIVFGENFLKQNEHNLAKIVLAIARRNQRAALTAHFQAMSRYGPLSRLIPEVHAPTLVLSASDDPLVSAEGARELAMLCGGQHKQIAGVGHSIPAEAPQWFADCLLDFLVEGHDY